MHLTIGPNAADWLRHLRPAWHADALCREFPSVTWFPKVGDNAGAARAICQRCLVERECLTAALHDEELGVWGGTTPNQRIELRRRVVVA